MAGSGGASSCVQGIANPDGSFTCTAGYPNPSWQSGTGVPADQVRDLPDVSLFAANGYNFSAYPICDNPFDCVSGGAVDPYTGITVDVVGGTSASSPAMAGIMALVNQATKSRQGQANFVLYPLAQQFPAVFHDVTVGSNNVPCTQGTSNCSLDTTDSNYTLQSYSATTGYDLASGLCSMDVNALISDWKKITFTPTTTTLVISPTSFVHGTNVTVTANVSAASGTPGGTISLVTTSTLPDQTSQTAFPLDNTGAASGTINFLPGGTYNVVADYSGDGTFASSTSSPVSVSVTPENAAAALAGTVCSVNSANLLGDGLTYPYGSSFSLTAEVGGAANPADGFPTGNVTLHDGSSTLATLNLNSNGVANYTTGTLTVGTHALSAAYQGDASFNAVTSPTVNITIAKGTPWMTLDDNSFGQIIAGNDFTVPVLVNSYGTAASGTVAVTLQSTTQTLTLNATLSTFNAPPNFMPYGLQAGAASVTFKAVPAGSYTLSATYAGDSNYTSAVAVPETIVAGTVSSRLPSTTTFTLGSTTLGPDTPVSYTVTVTGNGTIVPTGLAAIFANNVSLGIVFLDPTGKASGYVNGNAVPQGSSQMTAQYLGDGTYAASTSAATTINGNSGDFTVTSNNQVVSIASGSKGSATLQIGSSQGMSGSVSLACATSSKYVTCTLNPAAVTLSNTAATATLSINTATQSGGSASSRKLPMGGWLAGSGAAFACLLLIGFPKRRRALSSVVCLILLVVVVIGSTSCGGGSNPTPVTAPATINAPAGSYVGNVTATGSGIVHSLQVQVKVH